MTDSNLYDRYVPANLPDGDEGEVAQLFIFNDAQMLVKLNSEHPCIPAAEDFNAVEMEFLSKQYLGKLDGYPCYCMEVAGAAAAPPGMAFQDLRSLLGLLEEEVFLLAGRAFQIVNWNRMSKFCGRCAAMTEWKQTELAKLCPGCGAVYYPRISPAVIVAVVRGDQILLAHNKNFRPKWYSVLAGFVEPGETFEACVMREIMEEVGIKVKNVRYFGSQPWPFPDSLMVGFTAEYDSGEIIVDGEEIDAAGWYGRDNLPPRPKNNTIAGRLIESVFSDIDKG
ncbi:MULTISPECIES: NAD(+) diphosphatase [Sporomusa]|uniref:NAD(+) diphosphatase n=1 Tax=Sporomusa TaxID=2375 RepID=UPI002BB48260|nr:NAD(+) diphosphatase [Sporomusa sphaeroides]HML33177.1 NAD(+) diphosphatase [Sporomusa sphaeroides]